MNTGQTVPRTKAFSPARLNGLELRNRFIKAGAYEGMCPGGMPGDALLEHHANLAKGGVGMTTVAYCAVNADGRTFEQQMYMRDEVLPALRKITDACHAEGAKVALQLGHCGFFSRNKKVTDGKPRGPSFNLNLYGFLVGMPFGRPMSEELIAKTVKDFGEAAAKAAQAGFDAVELHMGHGYLLSQFISPATNHRKDRYGGSLENRCRFAVEVLHEVRRRVPQGFPILCKTNLDDGFSWGLHVEEAVEVAKILEREGADALVLSGGFTSLNAFYLFRGSIPRKEMIQVEHNWLMKVSLALFGWLVMRRYPFQELYFLEQARKVRAAVKLALGYIGGVVSLEGVERVMNEGFDFVVMARALVNDPAFVKKLEAGAVQRSACDACNKCVAEMDRPGGVRCVCADAQKALTDAAGAQEAKAA